MKALKILALLMAAIITGCATPPPPAVDTNNTAFYIDTYLPKGSISVVSGDG